MKVYGENRGIVPLIASFGTRCRWVVSFTLRLFYAPDRTPIILGQWSQVSAAKQVKTALFRVVIQHVVVIPYRRSGTMYRSHLPSVKNPLTLEMETLISLFAWVLTSLYLNFPGNTRKCPQLFFRMQPVYVTIGRNGTECSVNPLFQSNETEHSKVFDNHPGNLSNVISYRDLTHIYYPLQ